MNNFKEPSRSKAQQKAIDGILYGQDKPARARLPQLERRRYRGVKQAPATQPVRPAATQPRKAMPVQGQPVSPRAHTQASPAMRQGTHTLHDEHFRDLDMQLDQAGEPREKLSRKQKRLAKKQGPKLAWYKRPWAAIKDIKNWSWKKRIVVGVIALIIILGLIAGGLFLKGYFGAKKVFKGGGSAVALENKEVAPEMLKGEGSGRINILLLGNGGEGHEAPDLTDTIVVASIDPVSKKAALLSIPRDLWVTIPGKGSMKINAAYSTGKYGYLGQQSASNENTEAVKAGFEAADKAVEQTMGIPIHYNLLVNFKAFQQAIDTVGGITVNVPERLSDPTMAWQNGGNPIFAEAGEQTFDGREALFYVRSRYTTSDFSRSQRQRLVMLALQQKIFSLGTASDPRKLSQLIDAFGSNMVTDLSLTNVSRLYDLTKGITPEQVQSVGLADPPNSFVTTGMINNQSIVRPRAGLTDFSEIQKFVRTTLRDGYLAKEDAPVLVLNGTNTPGLGTQQADVLASYGYKVLPAGDAPTKNYTNTTIIDLTHGKKPYTANYLKNRYNVSKIQTKLPDSTIPSQNAEFVIILGQDASTNSQN